MTNLDLIDETIIKMLQEHGRRTNTEIADAVNMSKATIKNRINRLMRKDVLRVLGILNPEALDYKSKAIIGIRTAPEAAENIGEQLAAMEEIVNVSLVTGRYDIIIEVLHKSQNEIYDFLMKRIREMPGIVSTETFNVLRTKKKNYEWKLPKTIMF